MDFRRAAIYRVEHLRLTSYNTASRTAKTNFKPSPRNAERDKRMLDNNFVAIVTGDRNFTVQAGIHGSCLDNRKKRSATWKNA